jgi:hypothetical protein
MAAQDHPLALERDARAAGVLAEAPESDHHHEAAEAQVHPAKIEKPAEEPNQPTGRDAGEGGEAAQPAVDQGGGRAGEILQSQGVVGGFEKMKAEAHDERGDDEPAEARQEAGEGHPDAETEDGEGRQAVLADQQEDEDHQQGEEAGDLPDRLNEPHLAAVEGHHLHGEVIEENRPPLQADGRGDREDKKKAEHWPLFGKDHGHPAQEFEWAGTIAGRCPDKRVRHTKRPITNTPSAVAMSTLFAPRSTGKGGLEVAISPPLQSSLAIRISRSYY